MVHVERNRKKALQNSRAFLLDHFKLNPCVDCGESDLVVLDFDHVRGKKQASICTMIRNGFSISKLKEEIRKCDVRCANCHRRRTAKSKGWWSWGLRLV
jgi:hypothetical protein